MALLFMDGFDAGDFTEKWTSVVGCTTTAGGRYNAGRHLFMNGGGQYIQKQITPVAQLTTGFAFTTDGAGTATFFAIYGDAGTTNHLSLVYNATQLILYRGASGGTILGTANIPTPVSTWQYIEIQATINDTTGICIVKVDGAIVINFTGDTKNAGTASTIDYVRLSRTFTNVHFDDFYMCDGTGSAPYNSFLGDIRINTLSPSAAGSDTGFAPSTGTNYAAVDELPFSASDYVTATASGTRDLYAMSDISGNYSVLAVQNNLIAKKIDAGGTAIKPAIKSGGTIYYGSNKTLTASDVTISDMRTTDPATSTAWTVSGVNAIEAGMEIV